MVALLRLIPALMLAASGIIAAPVTTRTEISEVSPSNKPTAHVKVAASSLWNKQVDSIEVRQDGDFDLSQLDPSMWNGGSVQVKNKSDSLWDSLFNWWNKRSLDTTLRQRSEGAGAGSIEGPLSERSIWARQDDAPLSEEQPEGNGLPGNAYNGSAEVKVKAFSIWNPWTWWG
ncbi:uncharacterized protein CC84DRAFT_1235906 [Paraphaeosphaeria sporulosa]|uniref:Uncharacterized protein n=1 Tax=Paraphaeosphaeria sporulosa TaxID=1460663 RepID=A0A177CRW7_9PLEO|nr:uncharacterized protein CC84DRAFT_1235906 [Paraphaeosphaeria sporulosa]OAG09941.1 hypothetical protein CC84DRAFT_1235906 [Paraphaeosphaeria sporulosa]